MGAPVRAARARDRADERRAAAGELGLLYPRYLYGVLPAAGVAIGAALGRAALPYAATVTVSLLVLWAHLGTVTPFTP